MSTTYTTYLMIGIKTTEANLGISIWDNQWLPYIEGHPEVELSMIREEDNLYVGKVLSSWSRLNSELADFNYGIGADLILKAQRINGLIAGLFGLQYLQVESKLLFFTTAN